MPYPQNVDPGTGIIYFNVKDYGATGDGATDDADAIQDCINNSAEDSIIFFPHTDAVYLVGRTIQLLGNRSYLGTNSSTVKMADGADLVAVLASDAWITNDTTSGNPLRIANLSIDGNKDNNISGHGLVLMNYGSLIRECTVNNCYENGIMLSSINQAGATISNTCVEDRIESCKIENCLGHGIYGHDTGGKLIDGYIDSCILNDITLDAIRLDRSTGFFVSHNYCYSNQAGGISLNNCYNTFVIDNKIDDYGQDAGGNDFIAGIEVTVIGPRPTIVSGNIISTSEPAINYHYRHINVTFGGLTDTKCLVLGNVIEGGWDASPNNPGSASHSLAINYEANGTQTGGGQPAYLIASHNQYGNTGADISLDSYITPTAIEHIGDIQLDRHLIADNSLSGAPALAALAHNGTTPPTPIFSLIGGSDMRGYVKLGSGGSPSSGDQVSVTFAHAYSAAPIVVLSAQNAATAALGVYVSSVSTTGFNIATQSAPTASQAVATYDVAFIVIG